jgi:hypothetical protein
MLNSNALKQFHIFFVSRLFRPYDRVLASHVQKKG